jgi:tetratricopeptide (TPR) repeat protein
MIQRVWFSFAAVVAALGIFAAVPQEPAANPTDKSLEAARLNNLGAAYMNQQLFEKGLKAFQDATALDSKLQIAQLNAGIALLNLTRMDPAKELLEGAVKNDPKDPHGWFNLGLLYKNSNNPEGAIDAFRHVVEIDADDADSWYFLGATHSQSRQFPPAIDAFQHALKLNPLHASAEFGIARAYQQSGDTAQSREHLQRFQHITQEKLGSPIGLAYGDQGRYSLAEESPAGAIKVLPAIDVHFVDTTHPAGLTTSPETGALKGTTEPPAESPGACFLDYDSDGRPDLLLTGVGSGYALRLYHNDGAGKFRDVTQQAGLETGLRAISCTAGDYDNDGAADFAVSTFGQVVLFHNDKNGKFTDVTASAGIALTSGAYLGLTFVDYDHDGDLDLYVTGMTGLPTSKMPSQQGDQHPRAGNAMFRNNGNGTFTNVEEETGLNSGTNAIAAVGTDYNNDRAIDLLMTGDHPQIFENPREGKFPAREPWKAMASASTSGVAVLDFNHDGWMDIAFSHSAAPGLTLWRNDHGKSFEQETVPATNWVRGFGVAAFDYDNDGWIDLVAAGETKDGKGETRLFRNLGPDGFKDVTAAVGLDKIQFKNPRAIITGDYDNDGATDLLVTQNQGPAILLHNEGGNKNNWVRLNFKGLADNKSAIGTKVEVFAGGNRQKWEIAGSNGYLGQNSTEIIAGLGQAKEADVIRMLWPSGVVQDEIEVAGLKEHSFLEMDRRGSSCPTLFAWDGTHYALVGDMLGAGVVGHWVGPGQRNVPRPIEYVKIERNLIREKENPHPQDQEGVGHATHVSQNQGNLGHPVLSFRFMEPLEEVVYLDQVKLLAVDHPADVDVYPNEYFASNPPYPEFKVVFSRDARPPARAWDEHGHDVLPSILAHRYFGDFEETGFKGFAKRHTLELDLGEPYQGGPLWLLMHGEIEYFTATGMYAAAQAGIEGMAPYVEAEVSAGEGARPTHPKWVRVSDDMGFPAGGARTMTADLTGKLPLGTRCIRITTNLQIYWDNVLISHTRQDQNFHLTPVPLGGADLRFHGFPLKIEGDPPGNVKYVYEKASATGPYTRPVGAYTRYGDVLPLLTANDDRMAVFGSGDEIALDFDPSRLPALPQGWVRDYFFAAQGYEKDMDFYAAESNTVDPLPFRSMGMYPYPPAKFPLDNSRLNYLLNYNTRHLSGNEPRGYSFDYGSAQ